VWAEHGICERCNLLYVKNALDLKGLKSWVSHRSLSWTF